MYGVSSSYLASMAKSLRNQSCVEADIVNLDATMQSSIALVDTNGLYPTDLAGMLAVRYNELPAYATLEQGYLTASGNYLLYFDGNVDVQPEYYISGQLSTQGADENGEYPIDGFAGFTAEFGTPGNRPAWAGGKKPITIVFDGVCKRLTVTLTTDSSTYSYSKILDGSTLVLDALPDETYQTIKIDILTLMQPCMRARAYKFYCGTVESYSSGSVVSLSYSDINDSAMLELPQKKLSLSVRNLYQLSSFTEYTNPRYTRLYTQMLVKIGYDLDGSGEIEWVPMGRFFLDSYKVVGNTVSFSLVDSLAVMNEYTHYWSRPNPQALLNRTNEIMSIVNPPPDVDGAGAPETPADIYLITLDVTNIDNVGQTIKNPCPLVSSAAALQLHANATGNRLRILREMHDLAIEGVDLMASAVMGLSSYECFDNDVFETTGAVGSIKVVMTQLSAATTTKNLMEGEYIYMYSHMYTTDNPLVSVAYTTEEPNYGINTWLYAYAVYVRAKDEGAFTATLTATLRDTSSSSSLSSVSTTGAETSLSNPLVDGMAITYRDYADRIYAILKSHVLLTRRHRGYPQLDAGDIITVDVGEDTIRALIVENSISISNGAMRGSTKVRLLSS